MLHSPIPFFADLPIAAARAKSRADARRADRRRIDDANTGLPAHGFISQIIG
jgi:hypothetical protein